MLAARRPQLPGTATSDTSEVGMRLCTRVYAHPGDEMGAHRELPRRRQGVQTM